MGLFSRKPTEKDIEKYLDKKGLQIIPESHDTFKAIYNPFLSQFNFIDGDDKKKYITDGYISNADVYSIIRQISRSASVPSWKLYEIKDKKKLDNYLSVKTTGTESNLFKQIRLKKEALEEVDNDDIMDVFVKPNPLQRWTEFYELSLIFRLVTGNRYWKGVAPEMGMNKGKWQEIYVLPSQWVEILSGGSIMEPIKAYRLNYNPNIELAFDEVDHSKYPNPHYNTSGSELYGLSPLRAGKPVLTKSNDGYEASKSLLRHLGVIGMITNADRSQGDIDMKAFNAKMKEKFEGPSQYGKYLSTNYNLSYTQMGMNAVDLALNEGQMLTLRQLCNVYNFPSELLNDKDSNKFNSHKEAKKSMVVNAVIPELNLDRDTFNTWYLQPFREADRKDYFIDYDVTDMPELQEDLEKLWTRVDNSVEFTLNEKRKMKGADRLEKEGMDDIYLPANLLPLGFDTTEMDDIQKTLKKFGVNEYANGHK